MRTTAKMPPPISARARTAVAAISAPVRGMKPRVPKPQAPAQPRLDAADMQRLINGQPEEAETEAAAGMTEDRVKGLGYNASRLTYVGWRLVNLRG